MDNVKKQKNIKASNAFNIKTPFQYASNNPMTMIEPDGLERVRIPKPLNELEEM